ncbi:energy transducer TonB [Flavobacteriaceae bacterium]|nr:energy transducer TonB [Flavobacteriaceae bacterium]
MKKLIILILLIPILTLSQNNSQSENREHSKDTIIGRKFDFIKPTDGLITRNDFGGNDREPNFKKCKGKPTLIIRKKCFSETFYNTILKKIRIRKITKQNVNLDLLVKFTMHKSGKIKNIEFLKSNDVSGYFEKEISRIIKKLPKFEPSMKDGKLVSVSYSFPIKLKLDTQEND